MKKLLTLKNVLIAIAFTVFLLLVKDNMDVVWGILGKILSVLSPFFLGFMIAYILNFPYKFFYSKAFGKMGSKHKFWLNLKKPLSVICTYIIFFAVIAALIGIVVPQIAANLSTLYDNMPKYMQTGYDYIDQIFKFLNTHLHTNFSLDATVTELQARLTKFVMSLDFTTTADATKNVLGVVGNILTNTASGLYNFLMAIIISIYFLASKEQLCRLVKRLAVAFIPMKFLPRVYEIVDVTDTKCGRFLVGDILDAGLIGILTYIVMSIFHLPYAPMIAVLVGVTNIIPFFGPFIGAIPSILLILMISPSKALIFAIGILVIQQFDGNILGPKILGTTTGVGGFWVLFSIILGAGLFGFWGMLLGVPVWVIIYTIALKTMNKQLEIKGLPTDTREYGDLDYIDEETKQIVRYPNADEEAEEE